MRIERRCQGPIIRPNMDGRIGRNINGPSAIRVPDWIARPLGRYYLYFAHHNGHYIRLAYADAPEGPWHVYEPGALGMDATPFRAHIASPDLHVDEANQQLVMIYHGCPLLWKPPEDAQGNPLDVEAPWAQPAMRAVSTDGIHWQSDTVELGESYFRVFWYEGWCYAIAKGGRLYRSQDGMSRFEKRAHRLTTGNPPYGRHWGLWREGPTLHTLFSRFDDAPEHLLYATVDLREDWRDWRLSPPQSVLSPRLEWEGVNEPIAVSKVGPTPRRVHELRDPAVLRDGQRTWLFYSIAGEHGIGVAEVFG